MTKRNRANLTLILFLTSSAILRLSGVAGAAESAAAEEARLRERVGYLASDALEGRGVGTAGLDKAADYIAGEFKRIGLKTNLFDGTPFAQDMDYAGRTERKVSLKSSASSCGCSHAAKCVPLS